jgi:hypothetical protein
MEEVLRHYLKVVLPYRLYAIGAFEMALSIVQSNPRGGELECKVDGKLRVKGSSTVLTNPSIEMGIIHSRVLFEFLGLKAPKGRLAQCSARGSDINIESFGLNKVTVEQVLSHCNGDANLAEQNIVNTLTAANKMIAHSTEIIKIDNDSINGYFMTCSALRVLFKTYFYQPQSLEMPLAVVATE